MFSDLCISIINNGDTIKLIIEIGAFVISICTFIGALVSGILSLRDISINRRNKQLSDFITLFSDENEIKRLSGIHGLSSYSKLLFRELFFICSVENDAIIKELVFDELQKQSPHSRKHCIQINDFLVNYFLQHDFEDNYLCKIKNDEKMTRVLKDSQINRRIQFELNRRNPLSKFEQDCAVDNHLMLSSKLLALAIKKSYFVKLRGNLVFQSDMYASKWRFASIQNCVFANNISRHMFLFSTKHHSCYILGNNYYDSKYIAIYFINCMIRNCLFLDSTFVNAVFREGVFQHTRFDKSSLRNCRFSQIKIILQSYWNGCTISNSIYEHVQITKNVIKGTVFHATHFTDVKFFSTELVGEFKKCWFKNISWGGSKLSGVHFINCNFEDVKFVGANFKNCKFIGCTFSNTDLEVLKDTNTEFIK